MQRIRKIQDVLRKLRRWSSASAKTRPEVDATKRVEEEFIEGADVEGFLVNKVAPVPEFGMTMVRLRHIRTGCDYLHLARKDDNNVFAVCFRTTPLNSTGVSHVLEHVVLCGSHKYPCRDPFFRMAGRSLATFMNAMTGPDYTLYPFATKNKADYKNLLSVYLDAVFRPQLREMDFHHEGWRYAHEIANDKESPIVVKGIVYNEMKGVFGDNSTLFSNALLNNLLPSHTYGTVSGGDPKEIVNLTYADLNAFHKKHYHPSNCRMFSYGDSPLRETLKFINKEYLGEYPDTFDYAKTTKVPSEPRWDSERRKHIACRPDPMAANPKKQSTIAVANLCNDIRAAQETFNMQLVGELLVNGNNAPFYRTLIESNIGSGYAPATGYDCQTRDSFFSVGLAGVDPNDFEKVVDVYHKTVNSVVDFGFEETNINAVLHTVELQTRHQSAVFGLELLFQIIPIWNHDGDLTRSIKINDKVLKFKKSLSDNPMFLQDLVHDYLKINNHRLILTMSPDEFFESKSAEEESRVLAEKIGSLSPTARDAVYEQSLNILREKEIKQDIRCLPALAVSELAPDVERVPLKGYTVRGVPVQVCNIPTNGVSYVRGVLNTAILSEEAKSLLPLFCYAATKMGTKSKDYKKLDQWIHLKTGRFSFGTHIAENIYDVASYEEGLTFSSMCMDRNVKAMMDLWSEIFTEVDFTDMSRFKTIVKEMSEGFLQDLTESGDLYAISTASAQISPPSVRKEQFAGMHLVRKMRELSAKMNLTEALETMQGISQVVLKKRLIRIAVNSGAEMEEKILTSVEGFLKNIPGEFKKSYEISKPPMKDKSVNVSLHYEVNIPLSFAAYCVRTVAYTHDDFPILRLAARLLSMKYLLPNIREKGGAYGCSANISTSGTLSLSSFRDPKPAATFDVFKKAKDWLSSNGYNENDVEEAKLGVFQSMDSPVTAGSKGIRNFLFGISDDELQRHRKAIMKAKREDVVRVAGRINSGFQARCLIGPSNPEVTSREDEDWQPRYPDS